jgi:hypothetical protein
LPQIGVERKEEEETRREKKDNGENCNKLEVSYDEAYNIINMKSNKIDFDIMFI